MRIVRLVILTLAMVSLQISFFGAWRPFGAVPNVFLVLLLLAATSTIHASEILAMAVGGGLLLDLASGTDFGLRTAYFCFLSLLLIVMRRTGAEFERTGIRLAALLSGTLLYNVVILLPLLGRSQIVWSYVGTMILIEAALNVGLMFLLAWPVLWLLNLGKATSAPEMSRKQ